MQSRSRKGPSVSLPSFLFDFNMLDVEPDVVASIDLRDAAPESPTKLAVLV